jgi:GNAT superfamily N-acetyltransferase
MAGTAPLEFRAGRSDEEPGRGLVGAMEAEMAELYDGLDLNRPDMPRAHPEDFAPPGGAFLIGWRDGEAVCCGGVKRLPDGAAEIKRMYVRPDARRQGVARALLAALEAKARELGYDTVRLDTGPRQPHAQAMYLAAGFRRIANFNANPVATFFAEKDLRDGDDS